MTDIFTSNHGKDLKHLNRHFFLKFSFGEMTIIHLVFTKCSFSVSVRCGNMAVRTRGSSNLSVLPFEYQSKSAVPITLKTVPQYVSIIFANCANDFPSRHEACFYQNAIKYLFMFQMTSSIFITILCHFSL